MLARYTMYRRRPKEAGPLPEGIRQDSRWRTKHILRPTQEIVEAHLSDATDAGWESFRAAYFPILEERYETDPASFEKLAKLASENAVFIGCSCPTKKNPEVYRCHTVLALEFMQKKFPELEVVFPSRKA